MPEALEFIQEMPIRFADIDPAGVVYYPMYFHYYHATFEDFFGVAHGTPYPEWLTTRRVGFPTVHLDADFRRGLHYGDPLQVSLSVPRLSRRSLDFRFGARVNDVEIAHAVTTKACIDLDRFESIPIPDDLRQVLERYGGPE